MDIRNVNSGSNLPPDRLRSESRDQIDEVEKSSSTQNDAEDTPRSHDRVEISDAGQMASTDLAPESVAKLHMARRALDVLPALSADRAADIKERVENGYYSEPEQIRSTARGLLNEMMSMPPEGSPPSTDEG